MKEIILTNNDAREKLVSGINKVASLVELTYGPNGKNVVLETGVTNDGISIARSIVLEDVAENMGALLLKSAIEKTNKAVGDGTTSTTILTKALVNTAIENGITNPKDFDSFLSNALQKLEEIKIDCNSFEKMKSVALISSENEQLSEVIARAVFDVGEHGVVNVEKSQNGETYSVVTKGLTLNRGTLSDAFIGNNKSIRILNPLVLLVEKSVGSISDILPALEKSQQLKQTVLIVCEGMTNNALNDLLESIRSKAVSAIVIKGPVGALKKDIYNDIAFISESTVFGDGDRVKTVSVDGVGQVKEAIISRDQTVFISDTDTVELVKNIKEIAKDTNLNDYEKEQIDKRIASLSGGLATIYIGGSTEVEQGYLKDKADDAVNATRSAMRGGVVPAGAVTYLHLNNKMDDTDLFPLSRVLKAPLCQNLLNSGKTTEDIETIVSDIEEKDLSEWFEKGIYDPANVIAESLKNAVSVAKIVINIGGISASIPEKDDL